MPRFNPSYNSEKIWALFIHKFLMSIYLRYAKLKTLKLYLLFNYKHFKKCFIYLVSYSYSDDLFIPFPILQIFLFYF